MDPEDVEFGSEGIAKEGLVDRIEKEAAAEDSNCQLRIKGNSYDV